LLVPCSWLVWSVPRTLATFPSQRSTRWALAPRRSCRTPRAWKFAVRGPAPAYGAAASPTTTPAGVTVARSTATKPPRRTAVAARSPREQQPWSLDQLRRGPFAGLRPINRLLIKAARRLGRPREQAAALSPNRSAAGPFSCCADELMKGGDKIRPRRATVPRGLTRTSPPAPLFLRRNS